MKTAETILKEYFTAEFLNSHDDNGGAWMKDGIIKAMEEYARERDPDGYFTEEETASA